MIFKSIQAVFDSNLRHIQYGIYCQYHQGTTVSNSLLSVILSHFHKKYLVLSFQNALLKKFGSFWYMYPYTMIMTFGYQLLTTTKVIIFDKKIPVFISN